MTLLLTSVPPQGRGGAGTSLTLSQQAEAQNPRGLALPGARSSSSAPAPALVRRETSRPRIPAGLPALLQEALRPHRRGSGCQEAAVFRERQDKTQ